MTIKHDQILVVDIEATCWENNAVPPGETNEIIEIGACLLDTHTFEPSQRISIFVKPEHSTISPFCTQLTTITPAMIAEHGIDFASACAKLETLYESRGRLWSSWGNYDRRIFEIQCKASGVRYPFSDYHVNVRKLFARYEQAKHLPGMAKALELLQLPLEGTHHRGDDDAWNIAKIFGVLLQKHGVTILKKFW
jgi:inhibitor of KinA sporulation pathway (predicted exonuclease)